MGVDEEMFRERTINSFTYHPPQADQPERYRELRVRGLELAQRIAQICPDSRERSIAITKLEEVIMWANKAIACNE